MRLVLCSGKLQNAVNLSLIFELGYDTRDH